MSQSPFATSLFREAVRSSVVGSLAWLIVSALAGALATAATAEHFQDFSWYWALAWVWHLAVAGIGLWGLIVVCVHVWCMSALIHGTDRVLRPLVIAFVAQLTTSAIVIVTLERDDFQRVLMVWLPCATLSMIYLVGSLVKQSYEGRA